MIGESFRIGIHLRPSQKIPFFCLTQLLLIIYLLIWPFEAHLFIISITGSGKGSNCYWILSWRLWGTYADANEKERCSFWACGQGWNVNSFSPSPFPPFPTRFCKLFMLEICIRGRLCNVNKHFIIVRLVRLAHCGSKDMLVFFQVKFLKWHPDHAVLVGGGRSPFHDNKSSVSKHL